MWFCQQDKGGDALSLKRAGENGLRKNPLPFRVLSSQMKRGYAVKRSRLSEKKFGERGVVELPRIRHCHELPEILDGCHFRRRIKGGGLIF